MVNPPIRSKGYGPANAGIPKTVIPKSNRGYFNLESPIQEYKNTRLKSMKAKLFSGLLSSLLNSNGPT